MESGRIADALGDLLFGACCPGCEAPALGLCEHCRRRLHELRPVPVARGLAGFPATWAAGEYAGALRRVILGTKEHGALGQLPLLGELLARAVAAVVVNVPQPVERLILVPVPSVRARVVERGLDLTAELARRAAVVLRRRGPPVRMVRAVVLRRDPNDQAGLGRTARMLNSRGAYVWRQSRALGPASPAGDRRHLLSGRDGRSPRPMAAARLPWGRGIGVGVGEGEGTAMRTEEGTGAGVGVVVVDDVVTTGATLSAIAEAARLAGVSLLGAATVAQTPRRC